MVRPSTTTQSVRRPARWMLREPREDAPTRIFCFPYAGSGASMFTNWPAVVGPAEVCLVQLPGRENRMREPHFEDYDVLAEQLVVHLLPYLDRPFAFFGHCSGALPGYATAVKLAQAGLPTPAHLFVSSQVAPQDGPYSRFLTMNDEQLSIELGNLVRVLGGVPDPDLLALSLTVLRADVEATRRYRPERATVLPSRITAIAWHSDLDTSAEQMTGWAECAQPGRFRLAELAGSHYSFLSAPRPLLEIFAVDLAIALAEAGSGSRP